LHLSGKVLSADVIWPSRKTEETSLQGLKGGAWAPPQMEFECINFGAAIFYAAAPLERKREREGSPPFVFLFLWLVPQVKRRREKPLTETVRSAT
jgi:hypothetical protein